MKKSIAILLALAVLLTLAASSACQGRGTFVISTSTTTPGITTSSSTAAAPATELATLPASSVPQTTGTPLTLPIAPSTLPPADGTISIPVHTTTAPVTTIAPATTSEPPPAITATAPAGQVSFSALLTGESEDPPVSTTTIGRLRITFNAERTQALFELVVNGGTGISGAQLHLAAEGADGPAIATLFSRSAGVNISGTLASATLTSASLGGQVTSLAALANAMTQGDVYIEIYSISNPDGLIRGQLESSASPVTATVPVTLT